MKDQDPVRSALRNVRELEQPSPELEARLLRALVEAEKHENAQAQARRRRRSGRKAAGRRVWR